MRASVARPRDTLKTACPTGLQSVCNAILGELREERSEAAEPIVPPLSAEDQSKNAILTSKVMMIGP